MRLFKGATSGAIILSMLAATGAMAAPTRSATAIPAVQKAPVTGVRTAATLKHASRQSDDSPVVGYVLAGIMGAGIIAATIVGTDNDSDYPPIRTPSSPG